MSRGAPPAAAPAPFPRHGWLLLGLAAALGLAALAITRLSLSGPELLFAAGSVAVGFALARHAQGLARRAHARAPLLVCGLLLGFLAVPLLAAVALGTLYLLSPGR